MLLFLVQVFSFWSYAVAASGWLPHQLAASLPVVFRRPSSVCRLVSVTDIPAGSLLVSFSGMPVVGFLANFTVTPIADAQQVFLALQQVVSPVYQPWSVIPQWASLPSSGQQPHPFQQSLKFSLGWMRGWRRKTLFQVYFSTLPQPYRKWFFPTSAIPVFFTGLFPS